MFARRSTWSVLAAFALVGCLGAGVPSVASPASPAIAQTATRAQVQSPIAIGDVSASIPHAAFGPTDGLVHLIAGRANSAIIAVWVASNATAGDVEARALGGTVRCAHSLHVLPGTLTRIRCSVVPVVGGSLALVTTIRFTNGTRISRTYHHDVAPAYSATSAHIRRTNTARAE